MGHPVISTDGPDDPLVPALEFLQPVSQLLGKVPRLRRSSIIIISYVGGGPEEATRGSRSPSGKGRRLTRAKGSGSCLKSA